MQLRFTKMHGAGNDFVVLDGTRGAIALAPEQARRLADRHFGVGCDQILLVERSSTPGIDFRYRVLNSSGDEVEHCGNGARCFVRYVHDKGLSRQTRIRVETVNNVLTLQLQPGGDVSVDMNRPVFALEQVPFDAAGLQPRRLNGFELWPLQQPAVEVAVLSMGNPHAVQRVDDVDAAPLATLGPLVAKHPRFARGVNAGFMQIVSRSAIWLRVHERGAGETLACGTGACAAVVAGIRLGWLDSRVDVHTRGGLLQIEWPPAPDHAASVVMTGPATTVFEGEITL